MKEAALRLGLPVYQPERVRRPEAVEQLRALAPDAMVVVGYGQIIPQNMIDIPPQGIINVHASLLPKYRGAAPIQWAIVNGETRTGVTTMRIDAGLDTGDMLLKAETEIGPDETAVELGKRLAAMGAELLVETLARLGFHHPREAGPSAGHLRADSQEGRRPHRLEAARASDPQPRPRPAALARRLHHLPRPNAAYLEVAQCARPARRPCADARPRAASSVKPLLVACGDGLLECHEVQIEGRKRISAADFANGQRLSENEILGGRARELAAGIRLRRHLRGHPRRRKARSRLDRERHARQRRRRIHAEPRAGRAGEAFAAAI